LIAPFIADYSNCQKTPPFFKGRSGTRID
jgi:hypothetical protein